MSKLHALIDADILLYEVGAGCDMDEQVLSFEVAKERMWNAVQRITADAGATSYTLYLTGSNNFREGVAVTKPYKGQASRDNVNRPYHYYNLKAYLIYVLEAKVSVDCEADDELAMAQTEKTIICSRDKDLRMVEGWHYGWECGAQGEFSPYKVEGLGEIYPKYDKNDKLVEVKGWGYKFFMAQMLIGDSTDNIPGCPSAGPALALPLLKDLTSKEELEQAVWDTYKAKMEKKFDLDEIRERFIEQSKLLWMVRERDENGELVFWQPSVELQ